MQSEGCDEFDEVVARYIDAVLTKQPARLALLYAPDIRVFDTWQTWSFEGIDRWRENLEQWLVSLNDEHVEVIFEDVEKRYDEAFGCLSAAVRYTAIDGSGAAIRSMQNRLTWVLARSSTGWLIVHEHTSVPISFDDTRGILQRE